MALDFILVCDRPPLADRLVRLAAEHGCGVSILKSVEQAVSAALDRRQVALAVCARDARPLRALRRLRKQGSNAPILVIADETAIRPLQHVAAWAEFLDRTVVLYPPFTDDEFKEAVRKVTDSRFKGA